jgi:hypothetical protein
MATVTTVPQSAAPRRETDDRSAPLGASVGRVMRVDREGRPFVDFPGNPSGPVAARLAVGDAEMAALVESGAGCNVLLVFQENDLAQPIIVGRVRECLPTSGIEIALRGRRFVVETDEEIELRCGDAKIRMTREGRVVVLGNDVVSRARRQHKIKGGTVNIN